MTYRISRRRLIASATASLTVAGRAAAGQYDPRSTAEGQIKLGATLDGTPAWWIYTGLIYAVRPNMRPVAILGIAGCESQWAEKRPDGSYVVSGVTASFFRDPATGAFLDGFVNPLTGKRVSAKANVLSGGGAIYPADGSSARAYGHIKDAVVAPGGFAPSDPNKPLGAVRWDILGDSIMLMTDRAWNVPVEPQLEAQTQMADRNDFFRQGLGRLPARYSATTIVPWMGWLEMGDIPGHLVWHTSGEKVFSPGRVPADYRARAGAVMDQLTSRPDF